jgi:hypothetical protein
MTTRLFGLHRSLAAASLIAVAGCSAAVETPADYTVAVGQELDITLRTIGSGSYDTLPVISTPILRYLTVVDVAPYNPGGPVQQFSFLAEARGRTTLTFHFSGTTPGTGKGVIVEVQ